MAYYWLTCSVGDSALNVQVIDFGAPGEIRTPDLLVRSQALYPTELRARASFESADGEDDFLE